MTGPRYDAVVVGAGPNGLTAAVTLARAGRSVLVLESAATVGGGTRTAEVTLPGFRHDICSAVHPLGVASPFLRRLPLARYGLEWTWAPVEVAHPLDDGTAVAVCRSVAATAAGLGADGAAYRQLFAPLVADAPGILPAILGPLRLPRHPLALARFGLPALRSARGLAAARFRGARARALFAGLAAHSMLPLDRSPSAAFGLVLGLLAHSAGWPFPRGGAQAIADALAAYLQSLGGEIATGVTVRSPTDLPPSRVILLDLTPRQVLRIMGDRLPPSYRRQLTRYRYGPGVCKVDYALAGPIPWRAAACRAAGTIHLGGTLAEIAASEQAPWRGALAPRPFVLLAQPSLFDPTRAPTGRHTAWAYCHMPNGSPVAMTERIEQQIERFAPGFGDLVLARHVLTAPALEAYNPNYVGGDINGGAATWAQLFTRPTGWLDPYRTPVPGLYLCSSATPPGGGVHGMCGYYAARSALRHA